MQGKGRRTYGLLVCGVIALLLVGCSSTSRQGGYYKDDGPDDRTPSGLLNTPDAQPRNEPLMPRVNRPYTVFGKSYVPITDGRSYKKQGIGSWYGKKFHGNKTASGEIYDMYKMTAAHPILPIPSYVRVTNLDNGKQVIVRVNDRGPFHSDRIIDLSYTAALKLGYIGKGSGRVEVERVFAVDKPRIAETIPAATWAPQTAQQTPSPTGYYVQLGSFRQSENAEAMRMQYALGGAENVAVMRGEGHYRLMAGPFATREKAADAATRLPHGGSRPIIVQR